MTDITNFATLKAELVSLSKRTDLTTRLGAMVTRAESMIYKKLRCIENQKSDTLDDSDRASTAVGLYTLPTDCVQIAEVFTNGVALKPRTLPELGMFTTTGPIHSYATRGNTSAAQIDVRGIPGAGTQLPILYFFKPASLNADGDTNSVLTTHPELYLFASLYWIALDAKDYDEASDLKALFELQVGDVNRAANKLRRASATPNLITINHGSAM